jgi:hypothetical protein
MARHAREIARPRYSREARISTKGVRAVRCIQGNVETMIQWPINQSSLQHRLIPLLWVDGGMMQPARKTAYTAGGVLCTALKYLGPGTQSHAMGQAHAGDRPGQHPDPANFLIDCSRKNGFQCFQKAVIDLVGFSHEGTPTNPYNRTCSLIPFFENSYWFLRRLKFVSQPALHVLNVGNCPIATVTPSSRPPSWTSMPLGSTAEPEQSMDSDAFRQS